MTNPAELAPPHLLAFIDCHGIAAEFIAPGVPMATVPAAAAAIGVPAEHILKTLLFASDGAFVVAIANGTRRVDRKRLADATGLLRPRAAAPEVVHVITGYPAGGVAPIGLPDGLPVIVDTGVAALRSVYGGGGREDLLLRISPADVIRLNHALVRQIVADS